MNRTCVYQNLPNNQLQGLKLKFFIQSALLHSILFFFFKPFPFGEGCLPTVRLGGGVKPITAKKPLRGNRKHKIYRKHIFHSEISYKSDILYLILTDHLSLPVGEGQGGVRPKTPDKHIRQFRKTNLLTHKHNLCQKIPQRKQEKDV